MGVTCAALSVVVVGTGVIVACNGNLLSVGSGLLPGYGGVEQPRVFWGSGGCCQLALPTLDAKEELRDPHV